MFVGIRRRLVDAARVACVHARNGKLLWFAIAVTPLAIACVTMRAGCADATVQPHDDRHSPSCSTISSTICRGAKSS